MPPDLDQIFDDAHAAGPSAPPDLDAIFDDAHGNSSTTQDAPWWGKAASGYLSGISSMSDLAQDVFDPAGAMAGTHHHLSDDLDAITGVPGSTKIGEGGFAHTAASYVPQMVMGPEGIAKNLLQTGATALAGGAGRELGGPLGELAGVFGTGAAGSVFSKVANKFSDAKAALNNVPGLAAKIISGEGGEIPELTQAAEGPEKFATLAEQASAAQGKPNVKLAELEESLKNNPETSSLFTNQSSDRADARQGILGDAAQGELPETAGPNLLKAFQDDQQGLHDAGEKLYNLLPDEARIDTSDALSSVKARVQEIFGSKLQPHREIRSLMALLEPEGLTSDQAEMLKQFGQDIPSDLPLQDARAIRSKALGLAKQFGLKGDNQNAAVAQSLGQGLDTAIASPKGLQPQDLKTLQQANGVWSEMKSREETPIGKILTNPNIPPSAIFGKILQTPAGKGQFELMQNFKDLFGGNSDVMSTLESQAAQNLLGKGNLTQARIEKWMSANRNLLDQFPNLNDSVSTVAKDIQNQNAIGQIALTASKGQSKTAQSLGKAGYVEQKILDQLGVPGVLSNSGIVGKLARGAIGGGIGSVFGGPAGALAGATAGTMTKGFTSGITSDVTRSMGRLMAHPEEFGPALQSTLEQTSHPSVFSPLIKSGAVGIANTLPKSVFSLASQPKSSVPDTNFNSPNYKPGPMDAQADPKLNADYWMPFLTHQENAKKDPSAVSKKGAVGLAQVEPGTADQVVPNKAAAEKLGVGWPVDLTNGADNLKIGRAYLQQQLDTFKDPMLALAAYNAGPQAVKDHGNKIPPYEETQKYVAKILAAATKANS